MPFHDVQQGETLTSIAQQAGLESWKDIYDRSENAVFKELCEAGQRDPNILFPGERLFVPNKVMKHEPSSVDRKHTFKIPSRPATALRIVLKAAEDRPLEGESWEIRIAGATFQGKTGSDGLIEVQVPVGAQEGTLTIGESTWELKVGHLNPMHAGCADQGVSGAQARLASLGYYTGPVDGQLGPEIREALGLFQSCHGLPPTKKLDDATRQELSRVYGC